MNSAYQSCLNALSSISNGECIPIQNNENIYIGYELVIR